MGGFGGDAERTSTRLIITYRLIGDEIGKLPDSQAWGMA